MDRIVSSLNLCIEALIPNVTMFGDKVFKEVIQIKKGHKGGTVRYQDKGPYKKRKNVHAQRKAM